MKSGLCVTSLFQCKYWRVAYYCMGIVHSGQYAYLLSNVYLPRGIECPELSEPCRFEWAVSHLVCHGFSVWWSDFMPWNMITESQRGESRVPPGRWISVRPAGREGAGRTGLWPRKDLDMKMEFRPIPKPGLRSRKETHVGHNSGSQNLSLILVPESHLSWSGFEGQGLKGGLTTELRLFRQVL